MPEQAEPGDVGAGVNPFADRFDLPKQHVLAAGHAFQCGIQVSRLGCAGHGPCKQHSGAKGSTDQQGISWAQARFEPGRFGAVPVHCEGDLNPEACRYRWRAAGFHRVATDQLGPLFIQH